MHGPVSPRGARGFLLWPDQGRIHGMLVGLVVASGFLTVRPIIENISKNTYHIIDTKLKGWLGHGMTRWRVGNGRVSKVERTLANERDAAESQPARLEMTPLGWLVAILLGVGASFIAWQHFREVKMSAPAAIQLAPDAPRNVAGAPAVPAVAQMLERERRERAQQIVAWRAVSAASRERVAELEGVLQALNAKVEAIQKASAAVPVRASRDEVADMARMARKSAEVAKAAAAIDVASLPIESVSAQAMNMTGFSRGEVVIGNQKLAVGQSLQQGESIVAIDPESRSIVTNRRIINVTN